MKPSLSRQQAPNSLGGWRIGCDKVAVDDDDEDDEYVEDDEVKGEENNDIENDMVRRRKIVIDIILITWSLNLINDFYLHTNFSI